MTPFSSNPKVIRIRSIAYVCAAAVTSILMLPLYLSILAPRRFTWAVLTFYVRIQIWLLRWICGIQYRLKGIENLPPGPCILASRHEALWETIFLPIMLDNPAVLLKAEILNYPLAGPVARKLGYIGVDRSGDMEAAKRTFAKARNVAAEGRRILIFPSGTRDPKHRFRVQPGVNVLYRSVKLPCVPIVLNSGDHWVYGKWLFRPGTITVRILPAIPVALPMKTFAAQLAHDLAQPAVWKRQVSNRD